MSTPETTYSSMKHKLRHAPHVMAGFVHLSFVLTVTCFWPSASLISLLIFQGVVVSLFLYACLFGVDKPAWVKTVVYFFIGGQFVNDTNDQLNPWVVPCFQHFYNHSNWLNGVHALVLGLNLVAFLTVAHNESPPTTILLQERPYDHTLFGGDGGFKSQVYVGEALTVVQLAQKGYYYAEEYTGHFGMNRLARCNGTATTQGWRCYAVGVRNFRGVQDRSRPDPDSRGILSFFQPLPSPAYDVDVQVAVSTADSDGNIPDACKSLDGIYVQHVNGQGNVLGAYAPIVSDFAPANPANETVCAHAEAPTVGCVGTQRQTETAYVASLRAHCTSVRTRHVEDEMPYAASYLRIPEDVSGPAGGTVNAGTGSVVYTILIMRDTDSPPMLRVTPKRVASGMPLGGLFVPVKRTGFPRVGDVTKWQGEETAYDTGLGGLAYAQRYGENAPAAGLEGTSVPKDYIRTNYTALFWLYVPFFTVPILISWYYFVTLMEQYPFRPFAYTALFVRLPLLLLAVYTGSAVYATAQGVIVLAFMTKQNTAGGVYSGVADYKKSLKNLVKLKWVERGNGTFIVFLFTAAVLNFAHFGLWMQHVSGRQTLFTFTPYMAEYGADTGGAVGSGWGSTLFMPLIASFLMVEPVVTGSVHALILLANLPWACG